MEPLELEANSNRSGPATVGRASVRISTVLFSLATLLGGHWLLAGPGDSDPYRVSGDATSLEKAWLQLSETQWGWGQKKVRFVEAAKIFSEQFERVLETNNDGKPLLLGKGVSGRVYALEGGQEVIKVTKNALGPEETLTQNLPNTSTLLRVLKAADGDVDGQPFSGQIMPRIHGKDLTEYGKKSQRLSDEEIVEVAADLAVGIHALHTKIDGFVVLHCDLAPKNVMVDKEPDGMRAVILDFGISLVQKLKGGESARDPIFQEFSEWKRCRGTDWDDYLKGQKPFNAMVEWRELGHILFQLSESIYDMNGEHPVYRALFKGRRDKKCNYQCAAAKNIERMKLPDPLKQFIRKLILEHEQITDEVADVLNHPVFKDLSPHPVDRAAAVPRLTPSEAFVHQFGKDSNQGTDKSQDIIIN